MANGKDERYNTNRKVDFNSIYLEKARQKLESSGRIPSYDTPLDDHKNYDLIESVAQDMMNDDAYEAEQTAKDNDGVEAPRKFDKNTDGW
jgi:hypothetical protein